MDHAVLPEFAPEITCLPETLPEKFLTFLSVLEIGDFFKEVRNKGALCV